MISPTTFHPRWLPSGLGHNGSGIVNGKHNMGCGYQTLAQPLPLGLLWIHRLHYNVRGEKVHYKQCKLEC